MMTSAVFVCVMPFVLLFCGTHASVSNSDKETIVAIHNKYRGTVSPPATNMLAMKWDDAVAAKAQKLASSCIWGHDKNSDRALKGRFPVGQNIAMNTYKTVDWARPIGAWHNEVKDFEYGKGAINGKVIGHYTQMVWASSQFLGCGYKKCSWGHYFVCNYGPAGNYRSSIPTPYKSGKRGSACPADMPYNSQSGLCGGASEKSEENNNKEDEDNEVKATTTAKPDTESEQTSHEVCNILDKTIPFGKNTNQKYGPLMLKCKCQRRESKSGSFGIRLSCRPNKKSKAILEENPDVDTPKLVEDCSYGGTVVKNGGSASIKVGSSTMKCFCRFSNENGKIRRQLKCKKSRQKGPKGGKKKQQSEN